uniref:sigma-70 family RNA polymerase sigma factor n=1 Tax=Ezakiella massiliensis TaxID=1852374 RepID=UPI00094E26C3|nr:sigma-70 family RNA polymerase sigma factor [Ezakiella massiliensis]
MKIKNQNEYQMENQIENKIANDRTGECENKFENINGECNLNLDCPASSLGNRDVHNKVDGTADTLSERNHKDRYKNNKRTGENMKKIEKIIGDYRPLILASISRYCNLPGFFDDLYQDGVVEVIEAMKEYDPAKGTVGGYLKTRLKLFYINKYKRLIRRETDDIDEIRAKDQPSVMAIADHENKMLVARLLSILDPDERTVIELTFLMDMRASEVSKIMGISKRKVYYLKETGMRKLQKMSTRENLSMRDVVNDEYMYKGGGKKTYKNME